MSNIIAFIPARGGSKSIPLKNIKIINGKPLIYWTLIAANSCDLINKVYLSTDNKLIKSTAESFNFNKVSVFTRNSKNARDTASTEDAIVELISKINCDDDDLLVLMQATSPFTTSKHLHNAIEQLKQTKADSLLSAVKIKRFFWNKNGSPINYNYNNRPRRQNFEGCFLENGAFYINKIKNIKKYKNRLCGTISIFEMPEFTGLEIDEPLDWEIAEFLMKNKSTIE